MWKAYACTPLWQTFYFASYFLLLFSAFFYFKLCPNFPGDKQFKLACLLRRGLAEQIKTAKQPAPAPQADSASQMLTALLSHATASANANAPAKTAVNTAAKAAVEPPSTARRDGTSAAGWDLPERRHFRYRLEDVAFD